MNDNLAALIHRNTVAGGFANTVAIAEEAFEMGKRAGAARIEGRERWRMGYPDGIPGTPEYEPPAWVCSLCNTVQSRCQCDAALSAFTPPAGQVAEGSEIERHCASLQALSDWLLSNDLDMKAPDAVDVDPLDTIDLLRSLAALTPSADGEAGK